MHSYSYTLPLEIIIHLLTTYCLMFLGAPFLLLVYMLHIDHLMCILSQCNVISMEAILPTLMSSICHYWNPTLSFFFTSLCLIQQSEVNWLPSQNWYDGRECHSGVNFKVVCQTSTFQKFTESFVFNLFHSRTYICQHNSIIHRILFAKDTWRFPVHTVASFARPDNLSNMTRMSDSLWMKIMMAVPLMNSYSFYKFYYLNVFTYKISMFLALFNTSLWHVSDFDGVHSFDSVSLNMWSNRAFIDPSPYLVL